MMAKRVWQNSQMPYSRHLPICFRSGARNDVAASGDSNNVIEMKAEKKEIEGGIDL